MISLNDFVIQTKKRKGSVIGNTFSLPISSLTQEELQDEFKKLTLQAKVGFGVPPPPYEAYTITNDILHVPRFYGLERFGDAEIDQRSMGDLVDLHFDGSMTQIQEKSITSIMSRCYQEKRCNGCISVLPCGFGKTVKALKLITILKRKTIVFVHKSILADQWVERARTFIPNARIGRIQGNVFNIDADIVIAMVLTVAKKGFKKEDFDSFGFAIFDECHHMAARVMNTATLLLNAKYILGLTATKERADGLTPLLHWCLGPEGFRHECRSQDTMVTCMLYEGGNKKEVCYRDGQPAMSLMINNLASDEKRTTYIAIRMKKYWENNRKIIVLSDRIAQLKSLCKILLELGIPELAMGFLIGSTPAIDRPKVLERKIIMCTYSMANEGLDRKELDCLIMATPKGNCIQAIGRIQRPCEYKNIPLVLDVVDNHSIFGKLRWKRYNLYTKNNFKCQTFGCNNEDAEWFE
jgi:superfamily II DNA or RNA helicase